MLGLLLAAVRDLDAAGVSDAVARAVEEGAGAVDVMRAAERGLRIVGARYAECVYFLSGLIMAGQIFKDVMGVVGPGLAAELAGHGTGRVVVGTVEGDVHDIGKDIMVQILRASGFTVTDLGVDVPAARFAEHVAASPPDIVGLSGLTAASAERMREAVSAVRAVEEGAGHVPIVVGGGIVDEAVARYVGADYWASDVVEGLRICEALTGT